MFYFGYICVCRQREKVVAVSLLANLCLDDGRGRRVSEVLRSAFFSVYFGRSLDGEIVGEILH